MHAIEASRNLIDSKNTFQNDIFENNDHTYPMSQCLTINFFSSMTSIFYLFNGCLVRFTFELCPMFLYPIVFL